jgi:uncharacterized membrane protein
MLFIILWILAGSIALVLFIATGGMPVVCRSAYLQDGKNLAIFLFGWWLIGGIGLIYMIVVLTGMGTMYLRSKIIKQSNSR